MGVGSIGQNHHQEPGAWWEKSRDQGAKELIQLVGSRGRKSREQGVVETNQGATQKLLGEPAKKN